MDFTKKIFKTLLAAFLVITSVINTNVIKAAENDSTTIEGTGTKEFIVQEDAYVRQGRNTNYNFEKIGAAHGQQYVGKNIKALSSKFASNDEIITLLKFSLPSKEDLNIYDRFELEFNIFKNANFNNPTQTYEFYYTTDTSWKETELTWNNKPETIDRNKATLITSFTIDQGDEYEFKSDEEKRIRVDVTKAVESLVDEDVKEATFFITGKNQSGTSMLIHDRTSGKESSEETGDKAAKIIASHSNIDLGLLNSLIAECEAIPSSDYTSESYQNMLTVLGEAKEFVKTEPSDSRAIRDMYDKLNNAKNALVSVLDPNDSKNVAYQKPTRSNLNKKETERVTDGDVNTAWTGKFFPSYVDIDLMDTYAISDLQLYFPKDKVIYYTVYGSNDGKNYDELYQSRSDEVKTDEPDNIVFENTKNYRIVRVYLEYSEKADGGKDSSAYLSEIKVHGEKQNSNTDELRKGTFEEITGLKDFEDTEYAKPITTDETIENVYGIIDRTVGTEYRDWFTFEIAENTKNTNDYFELSNQNGKIHIKGNDGVTLATGLNYYYKNYAKIQVSEQTISGKMPEEIIPIKGTVRKETPIKVRYAFNYCTLSYTFAFFGEEEWQRENDWLALNGANVVLDLAGQEATWIKFLMNYGYSFDDAKDWLVGPGYYAWQFMDNMEVFGGPIPDDYVIDRVELARKTQRWKRSLGMQTVLQGYAGMVPTNFNEYNPDVQLIGQGDWNGFSRPSMIATDSADYDEMAAEFYEAQKFVYGETTDYYAVDPFHEGGKRPEGLTDDEISKEVLESMLKYDSNAVWTVQGWQSNPTSDLLKGMGEYRDDHVLIVDLIKYPLTTSGEAQYKKDEFQGTSWAWCLLGNFGGNPTMNGELQTMADEVLEAKANSKHMKGIGIISEATYDNPMIYDLMFDLAWADQDFDVDSWMQDYIERRYGGISENATQAWNLIKNANYSEGVRLTKELFGVRTGGVPRNIGKETIGYNINDLENALRLLLEDYDKFKDSKGYLYDISEIMRQVVSNYALYQYHNVIDARDAKDLEKFRIEKEKFLNAFDVLNEVSKTQKEQLGGEWIGKAQDRAANYDDFSKSAFEMNAKSLITTWGSVGGALIDYGFRTYEGMFLDVRKSNWIEYLDQVEQNLIDGSPITTPTSGSGYAQKYWKWVIGDQTYTRDAKDSPEEVNLVADRVLEECVFTGELDPNIGNIAQDRSVIINGEKDFENASVLTDGQDNEFVEIPSYTNDGEKKNPEIIVDLLAEFELTKLQLITDSANVYKVFSSVDGNEWKQIAEKTKADQEDKIFDNIEGNARYIKVVGTTESNLKISEVRVYGNRMLPTLDQLKRLVDAAEKLEINTGTENQIEQYKKALDAAKQAIKDNAAPDTVNTVYWNLYDTMVAVNTNEETNIALNKKTKAHNDPDGRSENINDGNMSTRWDGGRLSPPGKPYEDPITPGWTVIDLDGLYDISKMHLDFDNQNIWYQYELYVSTDKENWTKVGEKKTENKPNEKEDTYTIDPIRARYVKLVATNIQKGNDGRRSSYGVKEFQVYGKKVILNKDELNKAITSAKEKAESEYTIDSWKQFKEILTKAEEIAGSDLISQLEIDEITDKLEAVTQSLVKRGDISKLNALVEECLKLNAKDYTEESWTVLVEKLETAKELIKDNSNVSQEEVDKVYDELFAAKNALVESVNKGILENAIKEAEKLDSSKYTENTWREVEEVLDNAKIILESSDVTQKDVDNALKALNEAIKSLEEKPIVPNVSKDTLKELIDKLSSLDGTLFTKESWDIFQSALNDAEEVYAKENVTQEEIDTAFKNLNQAYKGLVKADTGNGKDEDTDQPVKPVAPTVPDDSKDTDTEVKDDVGTGAENNSYALGILFFGAAAGAVMLLRKRKLENK